MRARLVMSPRLAMSRRPGMTVRSVLVLALSLLAIAPLALPGSGLAAQEELAARGNQAYQDGDYAAAIDAYQNVLEAGYSSASLEYNLGNAYFKAGELGLSILHWERALRLAPGDADIEANLALARSMTTDAIEPMPRFWLFSVISWWLGFLPRGWLIGMVAAAWLTATGAVVARLLSRSESTGWAASRLAWLGAIVVVVMGTTLVARELGLGEPVRAVVLEASVPVRSAPAAEDDLTLFEVHEGTRVRVDQRTGDWAEVVLDDGKVGWVPAEVMEII